MARGRRPMTPWRNREGPPSLPGDPAPHIPQAPYGFDVDRLILRAEQFAIAGGLDPADAANAWDFYAPFLDVSRMDYEEGDELRRHMRIALGVDDLLAQRGPSAFTTLREATSTEAGVAVARFSPDEMLQGTPDEIGQRLALALQNLQVDAAGAGADAFQVTARQLRPQFYKAAGKQISDQLRYEGRHMTFDIETAGLSRDAGTWQISARLMEGDNEVRNLNLFFDVPGMDTGSWGGMSFDDFYRKLRAGEARMVGEMGELIGPSHDEFARGIRPFLEMAQEADYLVGQNVLFDVEHIEYGLRNSTLFQNVDEFRELAESFSAKARSGKLIDTRLLAAAIMPNIGVAADIGGVKRFSMENILLESTLLNDIQAKISRIENYDDAFTTTENLERYGGGLPEAQARARAAVYGRIEAGLHFGDIDTWFENHLYTLSQEYLQGNRTVLQAGTMQDVELSPGRMLRSVIQASSAMTPVTPITAEVARRVGVPDMAGLTPMEYGAKVARDASQLRGTAPVQRFSDRMMFETGIYTNWMRDFTTNEGLPARAARFGAGYDEVQERALKAGLPFADMLSDFERVATTLVSQVTAPATDMRFNRVRRLVGEVSGSGLWQATTKPQTWTRGNVALPVSLLQAAERAGVLNTNFNQALAEGGVQGIQQLRLSPFTTRGGTKEVALVADIFADDADIKPFVDFLAGAEAQALGIRGDLLNDIRTKLETHGRKYGVQIATLGGVEGNAAINRLHKMFAKFGLDVDSSNQTLRTFLMEGPEEGLLSTGPIMFGEGVAGEARRGLPIDEERVLPHLQQQQSLDRYMQDRLDNNVRLQTGLRAARRSDDDSIRRSFNLIDRIFGGPGLTGAPADEARGLFGMPRGRAKWIAAAAGAGYYAYRRSRRQEPYDETMQQMPLEGPEFYAQYGRSQGEPSYDPLATAGTVQNLDYNKTRHHQMGSQKYDHLFFGG